MKLFFILTSSRRLVSEKTIGDKIDFVGNAIAESTAYFPGKKFRKRSIYGKFILNGLHRDNLSA